MRSNGQPMETLKCTNPAVGELLALYEFERLPEDERRRFENHVFIEKCLYCADQLYEMAPFIQRLKEKPELLLQPARQGLWERFSSFVADHKPRALAKRIRARLREHPEILKETEEITGERSNQKMTLWPKWTFAAIGAIMAVFVLGTIVRLYYTGPKKSDYAALATLEEVDPVRWRGGASEDLLMRAIGVYQEEHYAEAVEKLKKVIEGDPTEPRAYLYLGLCYSRLGENKEAVKALRMSVDKSDGILKERSRWNLANAYLRLGDGQHSRKELAALIKESSSPYKAQAEELLRKIEQLEKTK